MKKLTRLIALVILGLVLALGLVIPAQAQPQKMVRVLIGFNRQPGSIEQQLVRYAGGHIGYTYDRIPVIAATLPATALQTLQKFTGVAFIEEDGVAQALQQTTPWGVSQIGATTVQSYDKGTGVKVAIIDTGIDLNHPDLLPVAGDVTFVSGTTNGNDDNGHGTHVAGIVAARDNSIGVVGVAPEAALYAVKVLDSNGSGSYSNVIAGINWAIKNRMQVINMSLGGSSGSTALQTACNSAYNNGIVVVAAAGNSGNSSGSGDNVLYPARYTSSVIAVAATTTSNTRASFSSTGPAVELSAPGVSILSTYYNGGTTTMSGTSMASPHVAGVAALIIASGITNASQVRARLDSTADHLGTGTSRNNQYGYGLVDAYKAVPANVVSIDHYSLSPSTLSTKTAGTPFSVTIQAQDASNSNITTGGETVNITFGKTDAGATPTSTVTTNGAATVNMNMTVAQSGQSINFTGATSGKSVTYSSFDVNAGTLAKITVSPSNPSVAVNDTQTFTAQGYDQYNNAISVPSYTWSCTNATAGSFNDDPSTTGVFTAGTTSGTYTDVIQATSGGVTGKTSVIVTPVLHHITVSPSSPLVAAGGTQTFTAQGYASDNTAISGLTYTWSCTNAAAGSIDSSTGVFTAATVPGGPYNDVIQAASGGKTDYASVTVTPGALDHITVSPSNPSVALGGNQTFTAQGYDYYGNPISVPTYTWSCNPTAGSINSSTGVFTAGTVAGLYSNAIHATATYGVTKTGDASVTVNPGALDHITVSPSNPSVAPGGNQTFTAQGYDYYSNPISGTYTWSCNPTAGGSFNPTTGISTMFTAGTVAGTYTIQATASGKTGSTSVTVNAYIMHVSSIAMSLLHSRTTYSAQAIVTVVNSSGVPVQEVTVIGYWSGANAGYKQSITNINGQTSLISNSISSPTTFTFLVYNLVKSGWTYDSSLNVDYGYGKGRNSISVP